MGGSHGHFTVFTQAEKHSVPTYIVGFVIGTAALCVAVISPLCGYLVSHLIGCDLSALGCSLFYHTIFSLQLPHLGVKFTQLAGLLWGGGALILFGY